MKASHSAGVNFRTPFLGCLLWRTQILSSLRPATSTQLPLYPLRELFIHVPQESLVVSRLLNITKSPIMPPFSFAGNSASVRRRQLLACSRHLAGCGGTGCCLPSTAECFHDVTTRRAGPRGYRLRPCRGAPMKQDHNLKIMRHWVAQPWGMKTGSPSPRAGRTGRGFPRGNGSGGGAEGAQLSWCAARRHRLRMDRSRP